MIYIVENYNHLIQRVKNNPNRLIVLKCYMPWCGYCTKIVGEYKEMSERKENKDVIFLEVNMEDDIFLEVNMEDDKKSRGEIATRFKISGFPTFIIIKDEKFLDDVVGANMEGLQDKIFNYV